MFKLKSLIFLILTFFSGCTIRELKDTGNFSSSASAELKTLLQERCVSCHSGSNASGGFASITDETQMVSSGFLIPGNAEESLVYQKLTANPPSGNRMPDGGPYLTDAELLLVANWINGIGLVPTITISFPVNYSLIDTSNNSATFTVSGACNIKDAVITIKVNGTAVTDTTCDGDGYSTTVNTTATPFATGANSIVANMLSAKYSVNSDSAATNVTKDLTGLAIKLTSPSNNLNSVIANRTKADADSSFINNSTDSLTYAISGTCNLNGAGVAITVDGISMATATCNGTTFSTVLNTLGLTNATHKFTATITNSGNLATAASSVYVFKYANTPSVSFETDIKPLLTVPRTGNLRACIDCHFVKSTGTPSGNLAYGYWDSCSSTGGIPNGASGACTNTGGSVAYTTEPTLGERALFQFRIGYYKYTNVAAGSNEGHYANYALSIVNDRTESPNLVANRIVRGNPNQSFIYKKLSTVGGNSQCLSGTLADGVTSVHCKTTQATTNARMPQYNATYIPNYFNAGELTLIQTWITEGARTDN